MHKEPLIMSPKMFRVLTREELIEIAAGRRKITEEQEAGSRRAVNPVTISG